ncbi:MAG: hypothetical protein QE487_04905 [Fluviicola sp.]|nr:hypothetical protein [Fluviicola sp.]
METQTQPKNQKANNQISQKLILFFAVVAIITACNKNNAAPSSGNNNPPQGESTANITLTAGGEEFKVVGPCGWASAGGTHYIGSNHAENNLRTFSAYFNLENPPTQTTTYILVDDELDTDPTHITMNISQIAGNTLTEWFSTNTSGTLTLVVEGNKISADLSGIVLSPQTNSGFFTNGNVGAFANPGALSGTLVFYI